MKKVRKRENAMSNWLLGACCNASAVRKNDRTITIRVKQVIMIMSVGEIARRVKKMTMRMLKSNSCGLSGS